MICVDCRVSLDHRSADFYDHANSISFIPTIHKPTRITDQTFSLIDNILVNHLENFRAGLLSYDVSDHMPIFLIYKSILSVNISVPEKIQY